MWGLGCGVKGLVVGVWGLRFGVDGSGLQGAGCRGLSVQGSGRSCNSVFGMCPNPEIASRLKNASQFRDERRSKNPPKKRATPEGNSQLSSNRPNTKAPENSFRVWGVPWSRRTKGFPRSRRRGSQPVLLAACHPRSRRQIC